MAITLRSGDERAAQVAHVPLALGARHLVAPFRLVKRGRALRVGARSKPRVGHRLLHREPLLRPCIRLHVLAFGNAGVRRPAAVSARVFPAAPPQRRALEDFRGG
eukprot:CAMPEP_0171891932 /NCGR_PEP_ID=MMETSP0992-20121227/45028_1 /TAXON_ID=483369 /ORGANISM="non described non described, Strain CCMP2098" /LENGTH=104 /DNA_ID=CAMNT_0012519351 /DNA_START=144 /DNA_END=455 /DNA_ORIENTATION=-